jgi:hypothetical protein
MSYQRMLTEEPKLAVQVKAWLEQAEATDKAEDAQHGKQRRLERIRAAKAQMEAEAAGDPAELDPDGPGPSSGMQERGARKDSPSALPPDKAQRNFTDGDSRIMPSQGGFIAGYNDQIAVDSAHQVITAHCLSTNPADFSALVPLIDQALTNLGHAPREVSGDTGFASEANIAGMQDRKINAYLCPGRVRHGSTDPTAARALKRTPLMQGTAGKIRRAGRRSRVRGRGVTTGFDHHDLRRCRIGQSDSMGRPT